MGVLEKTSSRRRVSETLLRAAQLERAGRMDEAQALRARLDDNDLQALFACRSGKAVSQIVPTLLTYPGPVVVVDTKAESLLIAGRPRVAIGRRVVVIDPWGLRGKDGSPRETDCFNPLDFIENGNGSVADIDTVLDAVMTPDENQDAAKRFVHGVISYSLAKKAEDAGKEGGPSKPWNPRLPPLGTLNFVHYILNADNLVIEKVLDDMIVTGGPARSAANMLRAASAEERVSILTAARKALRWLDVPELAAAVERWTFLSELTEGKADLIICAFRPGWRSDRRRWSGC